MLGHKAREFKEHKSISLEDLVPDDNFYRRVQRSIDLSFIRELVDEFYARMERHSIDPVVFFKLQLIALLMRGCTVSVETMKIVKEML